MREASSLLLIDGTNILRTVYEANPAPDSDGKADGAVISALNSFRRALKEYAPTHVLAGFDTEGANWRHALYDKYKETRSPMPQPLRDRVPGFLRSLQEIGLCPVQAPGFEAEDILATGFHRWRYGSNGEGKGKAVVLSSDKDLITLVAEGALLKDHFKNVLKDAEYVRAKFGVDPRQFSDFQALTGDSTDCIPGVSKIGAKTAAKLLAEFDTLAEILENVDQIKGQAGERLRSERDMALLSRKLVDLKRDVPLGISWKMIEYTIPVLEEKAHPGTKKHYSNGENAFEEPSGPQRVRGQAPR